MILTCEIGTFRFDSGQPLSHMKLVRDTVMAQVLQPNYDRGEKLNTTRKINAYVLNRMIGPASRTTFKFTPAPGYWIKEGRKQQIGMQHRDVARIL